MLEHRIAGRHAGEVRAVAVGEWHGRPVIVSGSGGDETVRNLGASPPLDPFGPVSTITETASR